MYTKDINIVGTIHTPAGLEAARKAQKGIDMAEFRADILARSVHSPSLKRISLPLIWTVRDPSEGGFGRRDIRQRQELYRAGMEVATFLDIELATVKKMKAIVSEAHANGVKLILSFHDFQTTPSVSKLNAIFKRAQDQGADIIKFATLTNSLADLSRLLQIFEFARKTPVAVMGMGKYGKVSRLLCAQAGSVLNYAWLHRPQVPGQWSAMDLAARFEELAISRKKKRSAR